MTKWVLTFILNKFFYTQIKQMSMLWLNYKEKEDKDGRKKKTLTAAINTLFSTKLLYVLGSMDSSHLHYTVTS